ncbi:MAG: hypothetical protein LBH34_04210 [Prevotellaceae bacterium]|nr:hypothetical protein [Prevotellaceae bacterium]
MAKINLEVELQRFDKDLFKINDSTCDEQIAFLENKYGNFFGLFCQDIIEIGNLKDEGFKNSLNKFLSDTIVRESYGKVQEVFANTEWLNDKLTNAFKYFRLYFPSDSIPEIYGYIAGFNQSVILAEGVIGIGLDKYLGSDYELYTHLGFYKYLSRNMFPEKIPSDIMSSLAVGICPDRSVDLLSKIIWEGKLLYFTKQMLPNEPDSVVFGLTQKQVKLCLNNETFMWNTLVEQKLLFSRHSRIIREFTEDAPFTAKFSREAPGKAANWIGYRIVEQYMKRNRDITLSQLLENQDYQQILEKSKYNPK